MRIELLVDEKNNLGEGPVWDVEEQRLYWVDSLGREVFGPGRTAAASKGVPCRGTLALSR